MRYRAFGSPYRRLYDDPDFNLYCQAVRSRGENEQVKLPEGTGSLSQNRFDFADSPFP